MRVSHLVDRHSVWIMLVFGFMYGFRTVTPLVIGTSRISAYRFFALNAAGALLRALTISCIGFLFGAAAEDIFSEARKIEGWLALAILGAGTLVWMMIYLLREKDARKNNRELIKDHFKSDSYGNSDSRGRPRRQRGADAGVL